MGVPESISRGAASCFATTNNDRYLKEVDRRFWPVKTGEIDIEALRRDRDQLWAEASQREAEGVSIVLRRDLWGAARIEQEAREEHDPWDDSAGRSWPGTSNRGRSASPVETSSKPS